MTKRQVILGRLTIATILSAGFAIIWVVAGAWSLEIIERSFRGNRAFENLRFKPDGTAVFEVYSDTDYPASQFHDLAGNAVEPADGGRWLAGTYLPAGFAKRSWETGAPWTERLRPFTDNRHPPAFWYLVAEDGADGSAHLVGYDSETRARIGYLGTNGFRKGALPEAERFPFPASSRWVLRSHVYSWQNSYPGATGRGPSRDIQPWIVYVQTLDNKIYQADLNQRTVRPVLANVAIRSSGLLERFGKISGDEVHRLAVRTDDAVLVLDEHDQIERRYPIPAELQESNFSWAETTTGEAIAYANPVYDVPEPERPIQIYWIDPSGPRTRHAEAPIKRNRPYFRTLLAAMLPIPVAGDGFIGILRPFLLQDEKLAGTFGQGVTRAVQELWPSLLVIHLIAAGLAVLCYRRQVRYAAGRGERILWPLFVFVFGLAGWVGYRFGRSWPVLEACPICQDIVPRDRVNCAACQVDWPPPVLTGAEVLA